MFHILILNAIIFRISSILWYKESQIILNGGHVVISNNGTRLLISKVKLSDAGQYTCVATNEAGTKETEMELEVLGKLFYWT